MTVYQERILNNSCVCNNCLRRRSRPRQVRESRDPTEPTSVQRSPTTRVQERTTVDYGPDESPADAWGIFCECGAESPFDRVWDDGDDRCLTMDRFKTLLRAAIETLEAQDVTLDREVVVPLALQHYRDEHDVNAALETAVERGVETAAARTRDSKTAALAD